MYLSLYCKGSKRLCGVILWEGAGDRTQLQYFDLSLLWPSRCVFLVLLMLNRRPRGSLCWVICYIISATSQVPKLHRVPEDPLVRGVAFPTTSRLQLAWNSNSTQLSVELNCQLHLDSNSTEFYNSSRPLDLWNRMFDRHQAEITVMQFTGHSLPVHQSMSVPWEFFSSSYFISQFPPTRFPLLTAIGMCHFLPMHHLEWHFGPGQKVKTQHYIISKIIQFDIKYEVWSKCTMILFILKN